MEIEVSTDGDSCIGIEGCNTAGDDGDNSVDHGPRPYPPYMLLLTSGEAAPGNMKSMVATGSPDIRTATVVDECVTEPAPKRSKCNSQDDSVNPLQSVLEQLPTKGEMDSLLQSGVPWPQEATSKGLNTLCQAPPLEGARGHALVINPVIHCGRGVLEGDRREDKWPLVAERVLMVMEKDVTEKVPSESISGMGEVNGCTTSRLASEQLQMVPSLWQQALRVSPDLQYDPSHEPSLYEDDLNLSKAGTAPVTEMLGGTQCWGMEEEPSEVFHQVPTYSSLFQGMSVQIVY